MYGNSALRSVLKRKSLETVVGQFESLRLGTPALSVAVPLVRPQTLGFVIPVGPSSLST